MRYAVYCPRCGRTFRRTTSSTRLNPHLDSWGNRCSGRSSFYDTRINPERRKRNHIRQLEALGYKVTLQPAA